MRKLIIFSLAIVLLAGVLSTSAQQQIASLVTVSAAGLEIQRSGTEDWVAVTRESIVSTGDRLRTNTSGVAEITMFNGSGIIQLKPNTEVSINQMQRTADGYLISIGLLNGQIQQTLLPVPDTYVGYEFTTPTTAIVTAGGIFDVWLDSSQNTNVLTKDGIVYVGAGRTQLGASQGVRAEADGLISEIITADSPQQLNAGIDGIEAKFATDGDIQLNIRQGPNAQTELLGTIFPTEIERVKGVSADGQWYRIRYGRGHGWVSKNAVRIDVDSQYLVSYPADHIERLVVVEAAPAATQAAASGGVATNAAARILQDFSPTEVELIARINEWRISVNLWPLKPNTTLRDMAYDQGRYLLSLPKLPDDLHTDAKGRNPRQRALDPAFNWPHYLGTDRVAIGENIYIGNNMNGAINYWKNSKIHHDTTVSTSFREIGVAILPHPLGSMYVVVFGSRPNVLPVLIDPVSNQLYVSSEGYRFASPGDWVNSVRGVQFVQSVLTPVDQNAWLPWARLLNKPQTETFVVAYQGDDNKLLMTNFNPLEDIAWLPSNLPTAESAAVAAPTEVVRLEVPRLESSRLDVPTLAATHAGSGAQSGGLFATKTPTP